MIHPLAGSCARMLAATLLALGLGAGPAAADSYPRQTAVDVLHYDIALELRDESGVLAGTTGVRFEAQRDGVDRLGLDFEGLTVDAASTGGRPRPFRYERGRLEVELERPLAKGEIGVVEVRYHGEPEGGLLIGRNTHGRRVAFAENWPDQAHRWFPCIDHPYDKATAAFAITAPERFEVVAPGRLVETRSLLDGRRLTRWSQSVPIPTYCMVVGIAEFSVERAGAVAGVPLSFWAYPQDAAAAARKFGRSALAVQFLIDTVGPYPFEKLAQIQSTTRIGGMENASAIFYAEGAFQKEPVTESPVPHEIAHQWFGDSVTPGDWDHLWVSEGFATYFDALFYERLEGPQALKARMARAVGPVKEFHLKHPAPVIDPELADIPKKLNPSNYQKGAWVLHMLRRLLGDETFFRAVRSYYRRHAGGNAVTEDVQRVMEAEAGISLATFFRQWLYEPGFPEYRVAWRWDARSRQAEVVFEQVQAGGLFDTPVELAFTVGDAQERRTVRVAERRQTVRLDLPGRPSSLALDPDGWLLHAATVSR